MIGGQVSGRIQMCNINDRGTLYPALRSTTIPYPDPYERFFLAP